MYTCRKTSVLLRFESGRAEGVLGWVSFATDCQSSLCSPGSP